MKTGTSMSTIIVTKKAEDKKIIEYKKAQARTDRAKICLDCKHNTDGWCNKHKSWCGRVNYICLNIKNPYEYKMPKPKSSKQNSNQRKLKSKNKRK